MPMQQRPVIMMEGPGVRPPFFRALTVYGNGVFRRFIWQWVYDHVVISR